MVKNLRLVKHPKKLAAALAVTASLGGLAAVGANSSDVLAASNDTFTQQTLSTKTLPDNVAGYRILKRAEQMPSPATVKGHDAKHADTNTALGIAIPKGQDIKTAKGYLTWCFSYAKDYPDSMTNYSSTGWKNPDVGKSTIDFSSNGSTDMSAKVYRMIMNGYPAKTPAQLNVNSPEEAYIATQIAAWEQQGGASNFKSSDLTWKTDAQSTRIHNAYNQIKAAAAKDTRTPNQAPGKASLTQNGKTKISARGQATANFTTKLEHGNGWSITDAKLTNISGAPNGTLVKQDGKNIYTVKNYDKKSEKIDKSYDPTKDIQIVTPALNEKANIKIGISGTTDYAEAKVYKQSNTKTTDGKTHAQRFQAMGTISAISTSAVDDDASFAIHPTHGYSSVHKQLSDKTKTAVPGVTFDLKTSDGKTVLDTATTDKSGNLQFKKFQPVVGQSYQLVEHADTYLNQAKTTSFTMTQEMADAGNTVNTIDNTIATDKPGISSEAYDPESRTKSADAKVSTLNDKVKLTDLVKGHGYKVTDTLYDLESGQPVEVDGKPVTGTPQSFVADGAKKTVNFEHKDVDLTGKQGQKFGFKAQVSRDTSQTKGTATLPSDVLATDNVDLKDEDQTITVVKPTITTEATAKASKGHYVNPSKKTEITDLTKVKGLVKDHKYTAKLELMEKTKDGDGNETVVPVVGDDNQAVTATKDFTATDESMEMPVDFGSFDSTYVRGKDLVIYYYLTPTGDEDNTIGTHADREDSKETIHVTAPTIKTTQTIGGQKSLASHSKIARLTDKVTYEGLAPGEPVTLTAVETKNGEGTAVQLGDKYLVGHKTFTPEKQDGDQNVYLVETKEAPADKYLTKQLADDVDEDDTTTETSADSSSEETSSEATSSEETSFEETSSETSSSESSETSSSEDSSSEVDNNDSDADATATATDDNSAAEDTTEEETEKFEVPEDTDSKAIDFSALKEDQQWTAFETAETENGDVIAEDKDKDSVPQTVEVVTPKDTKHTTVIHHNEKHDASKPQEEQSQKGSGDSAKTESSPKLAQTGASGTFSHNKLYNFLYGLFNK